MQHINTKFLAIAFGAFCLLACLQSVESWSCETHNLITLKALGNNNGIDSCWADTYARMPNNTIPSSYHHCTLNESDCQAREVAAQTDDIRIKVHLWEDSMAPPHWFSFNDSNCHYKYETKVRDHPDIPFSLNCTLKDGTEISIAYEPAMLDNIADYVRSNMNVTIEPTSKVDNFINWSWVHMQMIMGRIYVITSKAWNDTLTYLETLKSSK